MSLQQALKTALAGLAPPAGAAQLVEVQDRDERLACELTELNALACAMLRLSVRSDRLAAMSVQQLQQVAQRLAERIHYLLEPIHPIEIDREQCVVQMRSRPPQTDDDGTRYYELTVSRGEGISLRRYARQGGARREPIPAQLTLEVLVRLAGDFSAAAGP